MMSEIEHVEWTFSDRWADCVLHDGSRFPGRPAEQRFGPQTMPCMDHSVALIIDHAPCRVIAPRKGE